MGFLELATLLAACHTHSHKKIHTRMYMYVFIQHHDTTVTVTLVPLVSEFETNFKILDLLLSKHEL